MAQALDDIISEITGPAATEPAATPEQAPVQAEPDKPAAEPQAEATPERTEEQEQPKDERSEQQPRDERGRFTSPTAETPAPTAPAGDEQQQTETPDAGHPAEEEPTFLLPDGSSVTLAELRDDNKRRAIQDEIRKGYLRHQDYTQKRMAEAEAVRQAQERARLAEEILANEAARELLGSYPHAARYFMANPEYTRAALRDPREMEKIAHGFDALRDNPDLAERLVKGQHADELEQELGQYRQQREADEQEQTRTAWVAGFAQSLGHVIEAVAAHYGVPAGEIESHVLSKHAGVKNPADKAALRDGLVKLMPSWLEREGDQFYVRHDLIVDYAERLKEKREATASREQRHNAGVDRALAQTTQPPPVPPAGGEPAGFTPAKPPKYGDIHEAVRDIISQ